MAFSYNPNLGDPISRVRQHIGDKKDAGHKVEDETITAYLVEKSELSTAAQLARDIAAEYASSVDSEHDGQAERNSQLYDQYMRLAADLQCRAGDEASGATGNDGTFFGGIGVFGTTAQEVLDARTNPDLAQNLPPIWG